MLKKIVVVDDNEPLRTLMKALICTLMPGCEVSTAENAEKGIDIVKAEEPDIVFIDMIMPGMDGIEATARIKNLLPATKVVILTGYDDPALRKQAKSSGACHYMLKQAIHNELKPLLNRLLAQRNDA